jgi:acyl-CoA synthetase (AMP-forming)/AMP-acid ligase II
MTAHPTYRPDLCDRLLAAASRYPDRTALWVEGRGYTYRELLARAATVTDRAR